MKIYSKLRHSKLKWLVIGRSAKIWLNFNVKSINNNFNKCRTFGSSDHQVFLKEKQEFRGGKLLLTMPRQSPEHITRYLVKPRYFSIMNKTLRSWQFPGSTREWRRIWSTSSVGTGNISNIYLTCQQNHISFWIFLLISITSKHRKSRCKRLPVILPSWIIRPADFLNTKPPLSVLEGCWLTHAYPYGYAEFRCPPVCVARGYFLPLSVGDTSKLWRKTSLVAWRILKFDTSNITCYIFLGARKIILESSILVSPCFFGRHNDLFLTNALRSNSKWWPFLAWIPSCILTQTKEVFQHPGCATPSHPLPILLGKLFPLGWNHFKRGVSNLPNLKM